jgi:ubiquitin C-terminal hydrolase
MCGSDQYSCDVCGCKQDAVRQSLLEEVPEVLSLLALLYKGANDDT